MIPTVVQVIPNQDFKVFVYFADGKIKLYDLAPLVARGGVFAQIANVSEFCEKCTVMNGTLAWDIGGNFDVTSCLDIDPETIYLNGIAVFDPLESHPKVDSRVL